MADPTDFDRLRPDRLAGGSREDSPIRSAIRWSVSIGLEGIALALAAALWMWLESPELRRAFANGLRLPLFAVRDWFYGVLPAMLLVSACGAGAGLVLAPLVRTATYRRALTFLTAAVSAAAVALMLPVLIDWLTRAGVHVGVPRLSPGVTWTIAAAAVLLAAERLFRPRRWRVRPLVSVAALGAVALVAASAIASRQAAGRAEGRQNVVVIVLDAVGANRLQSYGYFRNTMPELEAIASRGRRFTRAFTVAPWTLPTHASMFTGLYPAQHGANQEYLRLHRRFPTLAELLRNEGYRTLGAVNNPVVSNGTGLDRGFAEFAPMWRPEEVERFRGRHPIVGRVETFLNTLGDDEPSFVFVNFADAHSPYRPRPIAAERFLPEGVTADQALALDQSWQRHYLGLTRLTPRDFEIINALHDAQLTALSTVVAELVSSFERRGLLGNTLVMITADHGDNIGEHGHFDHVFNLYDTVLRVPLILLSPDGRSGTDDRLAESVDVFSTALAAARVPAPPGAAGRNLLEAAGGSPEPPQIAEYAYPKQVLTVLLPAAKGNLRPILPYLRRLKSIRADGWKLIWGSDGRHELYHVEADPGETVDLAASEPARVDSLSRLLEARLTAITRQPFSLADEARMTEKVAREASQGFRNLDPDTRRELKALGYVN